MFGDVSVLCCELVIFLHCFLFNLVYPLRQFTSLRLVGNCCPVGANKVFLNGWHGLVFSVRRPVAVQEDTIAYSDLGFFVFNYLLKFPLLSSMFLKLVVVALTMVLRLVVGNFFTFILISIECSNYTVNGDNLRSSFLLDVDRLARHAVDQVL